MAKVKGTDIYVLVKTGVNYTALGGATDASISFSADAIDVTDKDSNGWAEKLAGIKSCEISSDNFIVETDTAFQAVETAFLNGTEVDLKFVIGTGITYTGKFLVTKLNVKGPYKDAGTVALAFTSTGTIAHATQ